MPGLLHRALNLWLGFLGSRLHLLQQRSLGGAGGGWGNELCELRFLLGVFLQGLAHGLDLLLRLLGVDLVEHGAGAALNAQRAHAFQHAVDQLGLGCPCAGHLLHSGVDLVQGKLAHRCHRNQKHQQAAKPQAQAGGDGQGFEKRGTHGFFRGVHSGGGWSRQATAKSFWGAVAVVRHAVRAIRFCFRRVRGGCEC